MTPTAWRATRALVEGTSRVGAAWPGLGRGFGVAARCRPECPPTLAATADHHSGTNGWVSSWGTNAHGEIAGCPPAGGVPMQPRPRHPATRTV